jgi:hypothetical protein
MLQSTLIVRELGTILTPGIYSFLFSEGRSEGSTGEGSSKVHIPSIFKINVASYSALNSGHTRTSSYNVNAGKRIFFLQRGCRIPHMYVHNYNLRYVFLS